MKGIQEKKTRSAPNVFISHMVQMKVGIERIFANLKSSFISHMVQMKGKSRGLVPLLNISFISHMVQMKACKSLLQTFKSYSLYPTWFRWKGLDLVFITQNPKLYIPHGSDERFIDCLSLIVSRHFISHMVQMKEGRRGNDEVRKWGLYIPHGSDESYIKKLHQKSVPTLYPTWFRWKLV